MRRPGPAAGGARRLVALAVASGLSLAACEPPVEVRRPAAELPATWRFDTPLPPVTGERGMVVTDAPAATRAGLDILRAGGNAIDAAVAAAFVLAVVYPEAGNLGGGGFMVVHDAAGRVASLDFRETAPAGATRDMFLGEDGEVTDRSVTGHLASGVPGTVAGLWQAHQRFGRLAWAELLSPAIELADHGFPVDARFAAAIRAERNRLARFPASAALFFDETGDPPTEGRTWQNPHLAVTLRRIAERGAAGFYEGETAELIVREMRANGGLIGHDDLQGYAPVWREPITFAYRGHTVVSMPPPSSGGVTLAMIANILEPYDLRGLGWNTAASLHLTAEAMRRAFADRNAYLGDPDFSPVPTERLLSDAHTATRRASIRPDRATPSAEVTPIVALGAPPEGDNTTHLAVVDSAGNVVSLTTTLNGLFGSAVTVAGAGFVLNNEMDDFTAKPGEPNMFGLVQGEANAIEPGKRMLSAMTPTIVLGPDGHPLIVTGARGGPRITSAVFQVISNLIDYGMDPATAVHSPRIHHQHLPDVLRVERGGQPADVARELASLGHEIAIADMNAHAPTIVRLNNAWHGVVDPRLGGEALGY